MQGRALFAYAARDKTEISFSLGDTLFITNIGEDGWYTGECRGQYGLFPGNYVKIEETNVAESASGGNDLIIKSLEEEIAKLRARLEDESHLRQDAEAKNVNLEQKLQSTHEHVVQLTKQKEDFEAQVQTLQQRMQTIRQHETEQVTALQTQVGEIQSELAAAKAALDEALRSKGLLQNEVEEYRALLNTQLQAAMDKTTASATLESLSAEVTLLRAARASSDKMTAELQQQLADVQAKVKDLAAKASNVDFLRKHVAKLRKMHAVMEKELMDASKRLTASQDEVQRTTIYSKSVEEEADRLWKQIQDLQKPHAAQ